MKDSKGAMTVLPHDGRAAESNTGEPMAESTDLGKSSTGMQPNLAALLSYVLGLITGLVFFIVEKDNQFVKFHAMQSICFSLGLSVLCFGLMFIPIVGWLAMVVLQLAALVFWIICMIKAYQGEWYRLPVVGNFAAKQSGAPASS